MTAAALVRATPHATRAGAAPSRTNGPPRRSALFTAAPPDRVAVLGGARLTNESAYAWAKLAKGIIGTDHVDAQMGDGLPAELVLGLPRATIDEVCAPGGTVLVLAPDLKEELPVLFLRLRHAVTRDSATVIEVAPRRTSVSELASISLLHAPGAAADVVSGLLAGSAAQPVGGADGRLSLRQVPKKAILRPTRREARRRAPPMEISE